MARRSSNPPRDAESDGLLRFVRLPLFVSKWEKQKLTEEDYRLLELELMKAPRRGTVIPGSGGLRKFRLAVPRENRGKSGSYRVFYAYFVGRGIVILVSLLGKSDAADLTRDEIGEIGRLLPLIEADLLMLDRRIESRGG